MVRSIGKNKRSKIISGDLDHDLDQLRSFCEIKITIFYSSDLLTGKEDTLSNILTDTEANGICSRSKPLVGQSRCCVIFVRRWFLLNSLQNEKSASLFLLLCTSRRAMKSSLNTAFMQKN